MVNNSVLLIAFYFAPHRIVGAKRFSLFSNYLATENRNIHVLTIDDKYFTNEKDLSLPWGGIVHRTKVFPYYPRDMKKVINRVINRFMVKTFPVDQNSGWVIPAFIKGYFLIKKYHINKIVVTGPPFSCFLTGYFLSLIFQKDLILDYQDPWFLYSPKEYKLKAKINWYIERKILLWANTIIFNTEKAKEAYIKKVNEIESKSYVIPNPFIELENIEPILLEQNKKVILYTGNFYGKRSLSYLIEPLKKILGCGIITLGELSIHVFGDVPEEDLTKFGKNNMSDIIVIHDKVDYDILIKYMKGADVLLLSQGDDHQYSVPYKLTDYLSIKRPILAITSKDSAVQNLMEEVDCGEIGYIDEPDSVYFALKKISTGNDQYFFNGIMKYSFDILGKKFKEII